VKFKHIEELESMYVTKGNGSTDDDIEEFKKINKKKIANFFMIIEF